MECSLKVKSCPLRTGDVGSNSHHFICNMWGFSLNDRAICMVPGARYSQSTSEV